MKNFYTFLIILTIHLNSSATPSWVSRSPKPAGGSYECSVFTVGNFIYVVGGIETGSTYSDAAWKYDTQNDTWSQVSSYPSGGIASSKAVAIGTKAYLFGGSVNGTNVSDVYSYNTLTNSWNFESSFPGGPRYTGIALEIGGNAYFGTGYSPTSNDWWEYNPQTSIWTQKASVPGLERQSPVGFSINNKGYVGLGSYTQHPNYSPQSDFYEFDPNSNSWTTKDSFPTLGRWACMNFTYANQGYMACGFSYFTSPGFVTYYDEMYKYDPATDQWTLEMSFPIARYGCIAAVANGRVFAGLGYTGSAFLNDWYELTGLTSIGSINQPELSVRYSNLINGLVFSNLSKFNGRLYVEVYSTTGALISKGSMENSALQFPLDRIASGNYIVRLVDQFGHRGEAQIPVIR